MRQINVIVDPDKAQNPEVRKRFLREAKIQGQLENKEKPVKADEKAKLEKRAAALRDEMKIIENDAQSEYAKFQSGLEQVRKEADRTRFREEHGEDPA